MFPKTPVGFGQRVWRIGEGDVKLRWWVAAAIVAAAFGVTTFVVVVVVGRTGGVERILDRCEAERHPGLISCHQGFQLTKGPVYEGELLSARLATWIRLHPPTTREYAWVFRYRAKFMGCGGHQIVEVGDVGIGAIIHDKWSVGWTTMGPALGCALSVEAPGTRTGGMIAAGKVVDVPPG
jgi:hypothetical protein